MKNQLIAMMIVLAMMVTAAAFAENTGIQMIGGPETGTSGMNVDLGNFRVGDTAHIEGLGDVELLDAVWEDYFNVSGDSNIDSGREAEMFVLNFRILNTQKKPADFYKYFSDVVCSYGDGYLFAGWVRQHVEDNEYSRLLGDGKSFEIDQLYAGRYVVAVTLPNVCIESTEPMSVTVVLGEHEITYHRK